MAQEQRPGRFLSRIMSTDKPPLQQRPFVVALTGGIASGKTLVSDEFARLGVPIVDMDLIAREIVEPGQPALKAVKEAFGPSVVDLRGRLKRAHLRALIFSDDKARKTLESILHPLIRQRALEDIQNVTAPYCILVIPLLSDKSIYPEIDRVLVVDADPRTQITRLMARDNSSREQAERALASQVSREQRLAIADDVLQNSGLPVQTREKVAVLHHKYMRLSSQH